MSESLFPSATLPVPVESFRSASLHKDPLAYPGERPVDNYITDGAFVSGLEVTAGDDGLMFRVTTANGLENLDDYLAAHNAIPMDQRIPVLAYGSNMCPGSLKSKFQKAGRADMQVIPTVYTMLGGHDVVWTGSPGVNGNFSATLYRGEETTTTRVQVGINLLSREQLLVLHATEPNYQLAEVPVMVAGVQMPAYYYVGEDSAYLHEGRPVAVASVPAEGRTCAPQSGTEMLETLLGDEASMHALRAADTSFPRELLTPQQYIDYVRALKPEPHRMSPRSDLKLQLQQVLMDAGKSRRIDNGTGRYAGWLNPSVLRSFGDWQVGQEPSDIYVLPTSELAKDSWADQAARQRVLDALSTHFHRYHPVTAETT